YGYAPDMTEGAGKVFVLHDPASREDAMHAALFRSPDTTTLSARYLGDRLDWALGHLGVLEGLIEAAMEDRLTPAVWAAAWRRRRNFGPYLRAIQTATVAAGHPAREAMICRSVVRRLRAPKFRKRLADIEAMAATAQTAAQ
ncbi:MAG: phosphoadenosine phosphosulfate reductase, partial [Paracoccaceae bacterium]